MTLAAQQHAFMAQILAEDQALPPHWDARMAAGLDIYRNAYRARLVEALRDTFPRTAKWVADEAFAQAAAHHLIASPPSGWTLDLVGQGFAETLGELFGDNPEVAELAWLEWAMHLAFVAADRSPLDAPGFAAAVSASEFDWSDLRLELIPGIHWRQVRYDCVALWRDLGNDNEAACAHAPGSPTCCVVWRDGHQPVCALWDSADSQVLEDFAKGHSFGQVCAQIAEHWPQEEALAKAGAALSKLVTSGMVAAINPR
jgi:hypothetical protein